MHTPSRVTKSWTKNPSTLGRIASDQAETERRNREAIYWSKEIPEKITIRLVELLSDKFFDRLAHYLVSNCGLGHEVIVKAGHNRYGVHIRAGRTAYRMRQGKIFERDITKDV